MFLCFLYISLSLPPGASPQGAPESTGGGDGACDEVQGVQAEHSAEMHLQCVTSVDAGALEDPSDVEFEWRRRCFEAGAEYWPPSKTEIAYSSDGHTKRARSMATGRYKAMKARIAAAVARKAKMAGAEQRAVEERRTADERTDEQSGRDGITFRERRGDERNAQGQWLSSRVMHVESTKVRAARVRRGYFRGLKAL